MPFKLHITSLLFHLSFDCCLCIAYTQPKSAPAGIMIVLIFVANGSFVKSVFDKTVLWSAGAVKTVLDSEEGVECDGPCKRWFH